MNKFPEGFQEWTGSPATSNALNGFQEWDGGDIAGPAKAEDTRRPVSSDQDPPRKPASVDEFVQQISPIAQRIAQKIGAPVDAVIGQLGLETGWGKSVIPGTNNYGNIKDTSGKGVAATDNMTGSRDRYRQYASAEEFADDYVKLVGTDPRYKGAVGAKDAQGFFTGLKQGGYAEDPNYVQSGVAASRTAAESLKKSGFKQESASLPDMTGIPKWSEISTSEKYVKLPDAEKARTKSAYFDELIAPYVAAEGLDVSAEKAKFIGVEKKEEPGLISRASDAAAGVFKAMNPFSPTPGLMDGVSQTVRQENTDRFNLPLSADTRAKLDYQYEKSTPEQRAQLGKADGVVGMYFTERNKQHAERDSRTQPPSDVISGPASTDIADPRFEARTRQLIRSGMTAEGATTYARTEMRMGMNPGGMKPGSATESDFDFELQDRFKNAPAVIRGAAKGYQGYKQGYLGILQAAADAVGADELSEKFAKGSKDAQGAIDAVGENKAGQVFEGAITSIAQQMPSLIGGALTGSEALVLGSMAVQSFGQEYAQGRMQNLNGGDAAKRASLFAAFEVVGEKFGLGNTLKAMRMSAAGAPTKDLAMELSKALIKETPGELITTTGQFATDKVSSFGLNQEAGMAEYLSQVGDTIDQTVMQSALMISGTGGVSTTARHLQNRSNNGAQLSEIYANDARDRSLSKWESNPLVRPTQSPQAAPQSPQAAPQSPQAAPQSPQAHPTSQVADAVVRDLAAAAGMDVESLIPTKTLPVQPADVEPIAAVAEAQGDSGIADQSANPESRELELWLKSSDSGLTPDEQAELSALQNTAPQEQTRNGIEQWPAASPDVATQSNDVQSADVQRSDGDQRRDMGEGQRPDTNAEASLPSAGDDLALRDEGPSVQALNPSINPQQEILSEPTSVEAQQAAPQGIEPQQMQADAASGITPWPDPGQPVTQAQTRAPSRTVPDDLLGMLNSSGGISSSIRSDIDQDAKGRPGLYRASGRNIDEIGALMAEYGYIAPDEANDSAVVLETLRRAVGGERIMTAQGMENMRAKEEAGRYRSELVSQAKQLGINPVGKNTDRLAAVIQQEMAEREAIFEKRKQDLIQESADAEQALEDVLALFGSDSPSFRWMADKFSEISARETSDQRKSGYDSLVRAARQAIRKWQADQSRIESVIERSLEDGYGSQENPFGPSEGFAGQTEPVAAAESNGPGGVQSSDGRGQGFVLEAPTEQTLAEKVAREQDQTLADKQTADAQREGFTLDSQPAQESRSDSTADMFGGPSVADFQQTQERERQQAGQTSAVDLFAQSDVSKKDGNVSTPAEPVQKTAETKQVAAAEKSKPNQETEASIGAGSDQFGGVTEMVNQERAEQGGQSAPARSYVRLQSFDHPSVGVLNNLREQKDAAWAAVKKLKSQVSDGRNDLRVKLIQAESAHKDLVRQESSARESVEEAANTQGLTTYKPSRDESSGPMFSRSKESRPAEKVSQDAKDSLVKMFEGLASSNEAFTYPLSRSAELIQCVSQVTSGLVNAKPMLATHEKSRSGDDQKTSRITFDGKNKPMQWELIAKDGSKAYLYQFKDKTLQLDVSGLESGQSMGTAIYQSVGDYAHNAGLIFEGDSAGVNAAAMLRRTENMISSALRWNSTNHLRLADSQKNPEGYMADALNMRGISWSTGDFRHNLAEMLIASYDAVNNLFPEINSIEFVDGKFQDIETWEPVTDEHFKQFAEEAGRRSGIQHQDGTVTRNPLAGSATLKRAALVGTVLRGAGSDAGRRLMAQASAELHARTPESLRKALYSLTSKSQEQIAREIFGNPNPKSTVDQITKELSGEGSLGSNIKVIQSALDLPANERRQVFQSSSADIGLQAVFFPDSGRVYLIADNIEPGEALSALLHDGGVHAGLYGMLGERGINSLAAQIKDWSINSLGKEEGRIAKLALDRIPENTSPEHRNEEVVAYFITEAVKSGHGNPKPTKTNAVARWFARLWKMVEAAIQKLGADPASLKVDDIVALARGALEKVKSGEIDPRRTGSQISEHQASRSPNVTEKSVSAGIRTSPKREAKVATTPTRPSGDASAAFELSDPTRWDKFVMNMQDKQINLKRVQQAISKTKAIQEQFDAYQKEELYHGRVAARSHKFLDVEMRPLLAEMQMGNISMDELDAYLWARHAKERNAQIRKINPEMEDGGSGLTDSQADDYFAGRDVIDSDNNVIIKGLSARHSDRLGRLAKKIDSITAGTKQVLLQYGLETKETISAWEGAYQHYVPLQREDMDGGPSIGQGFSVKGSSSKRAMGSSRKVTNILANLAMQREAAITRGEKNRVAMSLYGLAIQNKNPDLWEVDRAPAKRIINKSTGIVEDAVDTNYKSKDNVLVVRVGGEDRAVVFNERNERAMDMVAMLKNLDSSTVGEITNLVGHATRYFSSINTQYNPVFGLFNGLRDVQSATLNLSTTPLAGKQLAVLRAIPGAMRAIWKIERGGKSGTEYDKIYEDMKMSGGTTGYREVFRMGNDRAKALQKEIDGASAGFSKKTFRSLLEVLDHYNTAIENGTRLAAYKVAISKGISTDKAASIAKNLTVNFNRKGKLAQQVGPWYAFFNAAVQGTARTHETLAGPAGKKILIGGVTLGIMQALIAMSGFDDDEWEAIPEFVKQRNYIIPLGDGDYVAFPMPLGFNVLPNIGRIFADIVSSKGKNAGTKIADLLSILLDNANPLGSSTFLQTLSPTVLDPIVALIENKNFAGRPIAREDFNPLRPTPGFKRAKDTSSHASRGLSKAINYATGGTDYTPGGWSPTPDQLDYIFGTLTGGVGREFNRVYSSIELQVKGEKVPLNKIPVYGKFVGTTRDDLSVSAKYWNNVKELAVVSNELNGRRMEGVSSEDYRKKHPEASLALKADNLEKYIAQIRAARHKAEFNEKLTEEERTAKLKLLDEKITRQMTTFNTMVAKAKKGFVAAESGEDGDDDE